MVNHSVPRALALMVAAWMVCGCASVERNDGLDDDESWPRVQSTHPPRVVPSVASAQPEPAKKFILKVSQIGPLEVPADGFGFKGSDKTISNTFRRWADATEYSIVWDVPPEIDAAVGADTSPIQARDIKEAVTKVLDSLEKSGYRIQAIFYNNRVIRFSGIKK